MNISCIIIDDEPLAQKLLKEYIEFVDFLDLKNCFNTALEALPFLKKNEIELIFLDIEMPGINGMEFANLLKAKSKIIFTTAYSQYAVQSYEKNALDYLLKPISLERFLVAVNKYPFTNSKSTSLNKEFEVAADYIFVKSNGQYIRLPFDQIGYIEGLKDYVFFHTPDQRYIVHNSLKKLETLLPFSFHRVHYSYIVNLDLVSRLKDNHLHIFDAKIPVSRSYKTEIYQLIKSRTI